MGSRRFGAALTAAYVCLFTGMLAPLTFSATICVLSVGLALCVLAIWLAFLDWEARQRRPAPTFRRCRYRRADSLRNLAAGYLPEPVR